MGGGNTVNIYPKEARYPGYILTGEAAKNLSLNPKDFGFALRDKEFKWKKEDRTKISGELGIIAIVIVERH